MDLSNLRDLIFPQPPSPPPMSVSHRANWTGTSFHIIAFTVTGILAAAFLLLIYYIFVIKFCLHWHPIDIIYRFSFSRRRRNDQDHLMLYSPELRNRGLDESVIRAIPIFKFMKTRDGEQQNEEISSQECSVCLNEFQEDEKLMIIPNCCHLFHIDCIDIWLQNNANCPLCRSIVSCETSFLPDRVSAPSSSPETSVSDSGSVVVRGEDEFIVSEVGIRNGNSMGSDRDSLRNERLLTEQGRSNSGRVLIENLHNSNSLSPWKLQKVTSMGDECIDIRRGKDKQFGRIQPMRRSISMDLSTDCKLYLAVQEVIILKNREVPVFGEGGCSSSSGNVGNYREKRSFFSFGSSRRSRSSSILPLYFEP